MTPQELKESIIRLAMKGKLTEQLEEDGNGSDYLNTVATFKKANNITDNKKLTPIADDDILFDIPETWSWAKFGKIVNYRMGKTPARAESHWWAADVPWVSIADMPESGHINSTKERVSSSAIQSVFNNRVSKAGTLLMSFKLTVGRVSILDIDAVHNEAIISIYPYCDEDGIIQSYLFQILPIISQYGDSKNAIKGKTLNNTSICNMVIPIPPLAEQKRIVAKIEELMPLVDRYEEAWNKLEGLNKRFPDDLQKSILQLAIQGKLVPQDPSEGTGDELYKRIQAEKDKLIKEGKIKKTKSLSEITEDEIPFEIPENWKWIKLGSVASVLGGKRIPAGRKLTTENTGHIYIRVSDMKNSSVLKDNLLYVPHDIFPSISKYIINKDDIYITVAGTIGSVGMIPEELDGANLTENADRLVFSDIDQLWLIKCLQSPIVQNQIADATTKVGQPKLAIKRIQELLIPLPPLKEQKRIVAKIEELMPLVESLQ